MEHATHMSQIDYGCTHEKVLNIVPDIVKKRWASKSLSIGDQAISDRHYSRGESNC